MMSMGPNLQTPPSTAPRTPFGPQPPASHTPDLGRQWALIHLLAANPLHTPQPKTLPSLPIFLPASIIRATVIPTKTPPAPPLALPWYPTTPPPTAPQPQSMPNTSRAPPPSRHGRKPRPTAVLRKRSKRLANKEPSVFIDMTTRAVQLKALRNAVSSCSKDLQKLVSRKKILNKKKPLATVDLKKMAAMAGLPKHCMRAVTVAAGRTK
ncbi:hypothetical protein PR202_gb25064 [Eleusine coracana subsp. coracana]|uniref:Uncharacterized protein n=1 Tax=Eleusine coracana subsp. coracana TaxID=191504 RepID=A0AAV5FKN3_ELECO|nr:hypothetical protein PR202_gb25064 [Eleusine coracana subsp. coracana]